MVEQQARAKERYARCAADGTRSEWSRAVVASSACFMPDQKRRVRSSRCSMRCERSCSRIGRESRRRGAGISDFRFSISDCGIGGPEDAGAGISDLRLAADGWEGAGGVTVPVAGSTSTTACHPARQASRHAAMVRSVGFGTCPFSRRRMYLYPWAGSKPISLASFICERPACCRICLSLAPRASRPVMAGRALRPIRQCPFRGRC